METNIKIKTFSHYNDEIINEFLKQTKGKIVNYNPIVIEYDDSNKFIDPFLGKHAYLYNCVVEYTELSNVDADNHRFYDDYKLIKINIDTVLFDKKTGEISFMKNGKNIFKPNKKYYYSVNLSKIPVGEKGYQPHYQTPIDTSLFQGEGCSTIEYPFCLYAGTAYGYNFLFKDYLDALKCEKINYN